MDLPGLQRVQRNGKQTNYAAQPVQDMVDSGIVSIYSLDPRDLNRDPDETIDLSAKDEFVSSLVKITDASSRRVARSPKLQNLLAKTTWSMRDRVTWEREITQIVSEERHGIPGLKLYRSTFDSDHPARIRAKSLNELASDISRNTADIQFDCEQMSAVDGIVLQRIENAALAGGRGLKAPASYLRVTGFLFTEWDQWKFEDPFVAGNHVYLMSPTTGNIIEATADPTENETVYREPAKGTWSVQDYLSGRDLIVHSDNKYVVYSSLYDNKNARGLISPLKEWSYLEKAPELEVQIGKEAASLINLLNDWGQSPQIARVISALNAPGVTNDQIAVISTALRDKNIEKKKSDLRMQLRTFKNRMLHLKLLEARLVTPQTKIAITTWITETQNQVLQALTASVCDAETAHISVENPRYAVKEKLSGAHKLNMPLESLDASEREKLPWKRAINCMEDSRIPLDDRGA
jgi:hypothetical protein